MKSLDSKLELVLGEVRFSELKNIKVLPTAAYRSLILKKDSNHPIIINHLNFPSIIDKDGRDEVIERHGEEYVVGDYSWNAIEYVDIAHTDLNEDRELGDIFLISTVDNDKCVVYELLNARLNDMFMIYDDAILRD